MIYIILVIAFSSCVRAQQEPPRTADYAVDFISSQNLHVKFPYFEDFKRVDPKLDSVVNQHVSDMLRYIQSTLTDMLVGDQAGRISTFKSLSIAGKLGKMAHTYQGQRKKLRLESGTSPNFNKEFSAMFRRVLANSHVIAKDLKRNKISLNPQDLERRKNRLITSIIEAINNEYNPVSIYWDWVGGTVRDVQDNGEEVTLERELSEVLGLAIFHGYGSVIARIENIVDLFLFWSGRGWK